MGKFAHLKTAVILLNFGHRGFTIQSTHVRSKDFWFDFCFTALQHILGHFGRGQLT